MKSSMDRGDFIKLTSMGSIGMGLKAYKSLSLNDASANKIRVGVIGLDGSHSADFTKILNDPAAPPELAQYSVVAAYPKGTLDIESGVSRIPEYTKEMKKMGVEITSSVDELLDKVDVVLLTTHDGRRHWEQALQVFEAGKPVFIDEPLAASLPDVLAIFDAANKYGVPMFSSSALRYMKNAQAIRHGKVGRIISADTYCRGGIEKTHPDLYWRSIHGVEMLFTVMGTGCKNVRRIHTENTDVVVGTWDDGRIGTIRARRSGKPAYGGTAFGMDGKAQIGPFEGYRPLLEQIVKFFQTGASPVTPNETKQIYGFMSAAEESKRQGGASISLEKVFFKAKKMKSKGISKIRQI